MGTTVSTDQGGFSLIETMVALGILAVVAAGVLPLGVTAIKSTEVHGHLRVRTTEYAQDKIEQLMALAYGDTASDTRVFPAKDKDGSGLTVGGSLDTNAPSALYADYLDASGKLLDPGNGPPAGWYYMRAWQITQVRANLKQITVIARVNTSWAGSPGTVPRSTVTVLKTSPF
jgi:prepilin-type N-terminal cleavage/methylation domain-containing protein